MSLNPRKIELLKTLSSLDADTKRDILTFLKKALISYADLLERKLNASVDKAVARIRNGRDGRDGRDGERGPKGDKGEPGETVVGRPGRDGKDGRDGSPDSPQTILSKLLSIDVPWLTRRDRRELEALIKKAGEEKRMLTIGAAGGGRGFYVYIDGIKKGIIKELNFKAGTNMAIAYSLVSSRPTLTFNASGNGSGAITVETPTGTVDASNTTFTPSQEPSYVVADGTTYFDGAGYTWSTPNIIMDIPPSASIRAII